MKEENSPDPIKKFDDKFRKSAAKAEELFYDKEKTMDTVDAALKKAKDNMGALEKVWKYLQLFFSLLKDYYSKKYTEIPKGSIVAIIGALVYFLSPIDLMPDFIPMLGLIDDVFVLSLVYGQVKADLEKYEQWKKSR